MVFSLVFLAGTLIFFITPLIFPAINLPQLVTQKQSDFLSLERANSYIGIKPLSPNFKSFLSNLPQALSHTLFRPYIGDYKLSLPLIPFIAELILYQLLFILFLFFRSKCVAERSFILFCIFFSLFILLIIGYTVPVLWAIARYRAIYLPFLLTPVICGIDYKKIATIFKLNNNYIF